MQANDAYYGPLGANVPVWSRAAVETTSTAGAVHLDRCTFAVSQNNAAGITRSAYAFNTVFENTLVHHANYHASGLSKEAAIIRKGLLVNTRFAESGFPSNSTYFIDDGSSTTQTKIGPAVVLEGPTPGSDHYISWSGAAGTRPLAAQTIAPNLTWGVLTPNAAAGETQIANNATYTASPAFSNPADSSGTRLFDKDQPADDWTNACGLNWQDQTVTVFLGQTRNVHSVKLRMKHAETQRPKRVYIEVGDGSTWTEMGLLRPNERDNATNPDTWYTTTLATALSGSQVRLRFENEGAWGWYINEVKVYGN